MKRRLLSLLIALAMLMSAVSVIAADEAEADAYTDTYSEETVSAATETADGARQMEDLNRGGFAATNPSGGIYLSWRLLGTEPMDTVFNIYKNGSLLLSGLANTNYTDTSGTASDSYTVAPFIDGTEGKRSDTFMKLTGYRDSSWKTSPYAYFDIPLQVPEAGSDYTYSPNDASVGDVDGDGEYEIILKWDPSNSQDNASSGVTGNVYIDCYEYDGTFLWRIDLGRNIRAGAHYTQFQVYDYDGDGKAEVAMKTGPGTIDGKGEYVSSAGNTDEIKATDNSATYVNTSGHIAGGPEFLTVFSGETGEALQTIEYDPLQSTGNWGDSSYNRSERYLAGTAYLDGEHPSMIFCRGYYSRAVAVAYDWDGTNLIKRWKLDSSDSGNSGFAAQGNHQLSVADLDNDGKDEIVYGGAAIDDDGSLLWSVYYNGSKIGHGDALHVSDFDNDGEQEIFKVNEDKPNWGRCYINADGTLNWIDVASGDDGRGVMDNFSSKYGVLAWDSGTNVRTLSGTVVSNNVLFDNNQSYPNFPIYWDGDLLREHYDKCRIQKWYDYDTADENGNLGSFGRILAFSGVNSNNSSKLNPCLQADLFGDWREELIFRTSDDAALRVYTSLIPSDYKLTTLMHDSQYRCAIAWQNTGYNQPPHQSYYIGEDKTDYEQPNIYTVSVKPAVRLTVTSGGVPVSGITVKLGDTEKPTNSEGVASFNLDPGTYAYTIDQVGYKLASGTIEHLDGVDPTELTIEIEALPDSTITVTSGGIPVSGATVDFDKQTLVTDENGQITIKLRAGENSYTVSCHKYETTAGTVEIAENGTEAVIEIEATKYVYDSALDTDGSQFVYTGGDGAALSFSKGTWTFTQDSADGGRSFGADFTPSMDGHFTFEMTYNTGGNKDSNSEWNWTDRTYTHSIELKDVNGNVVIGLSQEYLASGAQEVKYYTGSKSKTNVSSGTIVGAPNITARSSTTWKLLFDVDLSAKTADLTLTDTSGAGYIIKSVSISTTSFAAITIGSTATGNVTWSPKISDVLYWSDCTVREHTASVGTVTGNGELKIVQPVVTPVPVADVANYYPTKSTSFGNDEVIYTDDKLTVTAVFAASAASSTYTSDFGSGYQFTLRIGNGGDISSHIGDVTSTGGEILSNGTTLILDVMKSGTLTTYVGAAGGNRTVHLWDNTDNVDAKDARTLDASTVIKSTFDVVAGHQYILYARGFTGSFIGLSLEANPDSTDEDDILVDELKVYSGETVKVKAVTDQAETAITTDPETTVTALGNGYYTFTMPDADTAINAVFGNEVVDATPEPIESATPEPEETATPEPIETATPEPEETATPEPEETATPEPIGEREAYTINSVLPSVDGVNVNLTKNYESGGTPDMVIVAAYDSETGIMTGIGFENVDIAADATEDIYVKVAYSESDTVIAYVWNSLSDIAPLSESFELKK